ncbi:MAG: hypothetical protein ABFR19_08615 [Pseudomonadota bacterium]
MLFSRKIIRIAAVALMLCICVQAVAFASPPCVHQDTPDQVMASAECHMETSASENCCEQQCQSCSLLSTTVSTGTTTVNSVPAGSDRIAHQPVHFYLHTPLPHFRPPLLTL